MQAEFDARRYLNARYKSPETRSSTLKFFYRFFNKYHVNWDPSKAFLLELGAGPSLQLVLASTAFFSNVVVSDFEDSCVQEVKFWVHRSPDAFSWKPIVKYMLKHCEGKTESEADSSAVMQREEEARRKISAVVHCDVTQENLGLDRAVMPVGGFDVITASASLTPAVKKQEGFVQAIRNARDVLKDGGYLCALIAGKCTYYNMSADSSEKWPTCYITQQDARDAIRDAGLYLEEIEIIDPVPGLAVATDLYLCIAKK